MPSRSSRTSKESTAGKRPGGAGCALVIVESPAKAKTILRILGAGYQVKASMGHVRDLPKSRLGVDVQDGFRPEYQLMRGRTKAVDELKKAARGAERIFLAPDPDREGEAIAWHLLEVLRGRGSDADARFFRVAFNEITPPAVRKAFAEPGRIDMRKVDSQQARRILDRLVGYGISPLLWRKVAPGLSAGRVQSVALRLICDREREIREFTAREYWTIDVDLERGPEERFRARLARWNGEKAEIGNEATAQSVASMLGASQCRVARVRETPKKRWPSPPLITSTLQQAASSMLRMSTSQTMMIAQQLYEGVDLGERGSVGLITYMRTDAPRVSSEAQAAARGFIERAYGAAYCPDRPPAYKARRGAQEAHEAIRPTDVELRPEDVAPFLSRQQSAIYRLVWERFVASQMSPARLVTLAADIDARPEGAPDTFVLRATSTRVEFDGWLRLAEQRKGRQAAAEEEDKAGENGEEGSIETALPDLREGDAVSVLGVKPAQHFTEPPPRYSEATLVRALEERGIGRPSTYAPTVATIRKRKYVETVKRRLAPTRLGEIVNELMVNHFPDLVNFEFTARMEDDLDRVEQGDEDWRELLTRYHGQLEGALAKASEAMDRAPEPTDIPCDVCGAPMVIRWNRRGEFLSCSTYPACRNSKSFRRGEGGAIEVAKTEPTDIACDVCGAPMVIRWSRRGEFLSCSTYPACKNSKSFRRRDDGAVEVAEAEATDETCGKCGRPMIVRSGRYGKFLACSGYPECRNTRPVPTNVDCPRPGCGGRLVERRSRRKTVFYGCSRYPDCDYATRSLDEVTADGQASDT